MGRIMSAAKCVWEIKRIYGNQRNDVAMVAGCCGKVAVTGIPVKKKKISCLSCGKQVKVRSRV